MSFWTLVRAELWRRKERTICTIISLAVGFLLFGLLQSVNLAFGAAVARSHADRLMITERYGGGMPLAYLSRIERVPGVAQVAWFGLLITHYRDPKQPLMVLATSPAFFSVLDEYKTSVVAVNRLVSTRTGLIVLDTVAKRFGWKVGDQVSLLDGPRVWTFDIVGIVTCPTNPAHPPFAVANYAYFDASRRRGTVAYFVARVADPRRAVYVARSIDRLFVNSPAPTHSQQESEFAGSLVSEISGATRLTNSPSPAVEFAERSFQAFASCAERRIGIPRYGAPQ